MEYYDGQILKNAQEHKDFANWTNSHGNKFFDTANGDGTYTVHKQPEPSAPTKEEQEQARANAYASEIDPLHARKARKTILGEWTEEDEAEYVAKVKELSAEIVARYPYPTDPIYEEPKEEENETTEETSEM